MNNIRFFILSIMLLIGFFAVRPAEPAGKEEIQKLYWDDKSIQAEGAVIDGKKQGKWTFYYKTIGKKEAEGPYIDDLKEGLWTAYYSTGEKMIEGKWEKNLQTGAWKYFYQNGKVKTQGTMERGLKTGEWIAFDEEGNIAIKENYIIIEKDVSGKTMMVGVIDGSRTAYFKNGKLRTVEQFMRGVKEGPSETYYESGQVKEAAQFKSNKRNGKAFVNWENGNKKEEGNYADDFKSGLWSHYYLNGKIQMTGSYVKVRKEIPRTKIKKDESTEPAEPEYREYSAPTGHWIYYAQEGLVQKEGDFLNGSESGRWRFYSYQNGKKYLAMLLPISGGSTSVPRKEVPLSGAELAQAEQEEMKRAESSKKKNLPYKKREKFTTFVYETASFCELYSPGGQLAGRGAMTDSARAIYEGYKNGSKAGTIETDAALNDDPKNGITYRWTGQWRPPKKNGPWTEYQAGGKAKFEANYTMDKLMGKYVEYYPDTKTKKIEANYMLNRLQGRYVEYFRDGRTRAEGSFTNGKKSGDWKVVNQDGSPNEEESGKFLNGKKFGFKKSN